jgi:hypothetical protein
MVLYSKEVQHLGWFFENLTTFSNLYFHFILEGFECKGICRHLYKKHALSLPTKGKGNKVHKSKKWWYGKKNCKDWCVLTQKNL